MLDREEDETLPMSSEEDPSKFAASCSSSSALSTMAIESIKSILNSEQHSGHEGRQLSHLGNQVDSSHRSHTVRTISQQLPPDRPVKRAWRRLKNSHSVNSVNSSSTDKDGQDSHNQPRSNGEDTNANNSEHLPENSRAAVGSKPKLTNMSLLSSTVAYATLKRCLLGVEGEPTRQDSIDNTNADHFQDSKTIPSQTTMDYSKQCKSGHIIDLLELRRLSSRGIPDGPPEPSTLSSRPSALNDPHRSYRPLVWRVLLGYLPPRTDLWNDFLSSDRKLYASLVKDLFSTTCPSPHEVYHDHTLKKDSNIDNYNDGNSRQIEEAHDTLLKENHVLWTKNGNSTCESTEQPTLEAHVQDCSVMGHCPAAPMSATGRNEGTVPPPPPPITTPSTPTPSTPGLLSARMQQEWVRGEDSVFHTPNGTSSSLNSEVVNRRVERISPMCVMNTPRVSSIKKHSSIVVRTITDEENNSNENSLFKLKTDINMMTETLRNNQDGMSCEEDGRENDVLSDMLNSLSLPNDLGEMQDEIDKAEVEGEPDFCEENINIASPKSLSGTGVELCQSGENRRYSNSLSMDSDEVENLHLLDEIRKDVIRTHPDLRFFLEPKEDLGQKRYAALERILFVWAKLNKGVRYVQGMNEIVGTLYFVLAHDSNEDWANEAEADTYFLFNSLMVEMRDIFVPDLDEADTGIHGRISNMITLLALHDPEVRCHLDSVGIDPSFYSVRWLTTLLSREFLLPDTIRLWDSMFASTHKDNFLRYVSVTMVMVIRDKLLQGDFSTCLRLLQAYPPTNLDRLLESSRALWIYESQITLACHKGGISLGNALRSISPPPAIIMAYGLTGGVAPPISEQVRQAGERGLAAARGAANDASHSVANVGKSFFGSAMDYWRSGSSVNKEKKEIQRAKTSSI